VFSRTSCKYYCSELIASLLALLLSVSAAVLTDRISDSDALISVVSALGGTAGFLGGIAGLYALLHIRAYRSRQRHFGSDIRAMTRATLHGVLAMYAFRIPCQFALQKVGVAPALAALVSQGLSGLVATAVRARHNYRANIFGPARGPSTAKAVAAKESL
jgi:hypothetical protein